MDLGTPQLSVSRVFDAPRALVYRAFTDPDQVGEWWGPIGSSVEPGSMSFDVRPGGHQRWIALSADHPGMRVTIDMALDDAVEGVLLVGTIRVSEQQQRGFAPYSTQFRIEFHDEPDGRTRLEIRQWLPEEMVGPSSAGWEEAFTRLEALLAAS